METTKYKVMTAEEYLLNTIEVYNKSVNNISKFKFSQREIELFTAMMDNYAEQFKQ